MDASIVETAAFAKGDCAFKLDEKIEGVVSFGFASPVVGAGEGCVQGDDDGLPQDEKPPV